MRTVLWLLVCGCVMSDVLSQQPAWGQASSSGSGATIVLQEDFEGELKGDWSHSRTEQTPLGNNTFLGQFGSETVILALPNIGPHKLLRISFDLYVIRTWDGSHPVFGPDIWQLSLVNGPTLLRTTFNNCRRVGSDQQSYPDNFPCPPHPCWTGAAAHEKLGYSYQFKTRGTVPMDSVYRIEAVVPHSRPLLGLQFAAMYHDKLLDNQSWGIDNLVVHTIGDFQALSDAELEEQWQSLAHNDPVKGVDAVWRLVAAGDRAAALIVDKLRVNEEHMQREIDEGARLLEVIMKVEPREWEAVMELTAKKLADLQPRAIAALKERFAAPGGSVLSKMFEQVEAIQAMRQSNPKQAEDEAWRWRRVKRILGILDTPMARRALWTLSEPGKFDTKDQQYLETELRCD